jgi:hypothetical protein
MRIKLLLIGLFASVLAQAATVTSPPSILGNVTSSLQAVNDGTGTALGLSLSTTAISASLPYTSTVTTGTAPFIVASTTPVTNLSIGGNAATVTTNANMSGVITSVGNATSIASQTGTGSVFVVQNTPTLTTPVIGAATGTSAVLSGGVVSTGTFTGTFTHGIAVDYTSGTGRVSVGTADGISFYNGGIASTLMASIASTGVSAPRFISTSTFETATVTGAAPSATTNFDVNTQGVQLYTTNAANNWTLNVRGNSTTTLNSILGIGQSVTIAVLTTQGTTAYYQSAMTIDGTSVTPVWSGGTAPSAGNASGIDVYSIVIIKTASATYTVLATQAKF